MQLHFAPNAEIRTFSNSGQALQRARYELLGTPIFDNKEESPEKIVAGDLVRFLGCSEEQVRWGDNDDPNPILLLGTVYHIREVETHSCYTKVSLEGIQGRFNSVCFEKVIG